MAQNKEKETVKGWTQEAVGPKRAVGHCKDLSFRLK